MALMVLTAFGTACTPALDWRQVTPEGAGLQLMFPCKPERESRSQPGPSGAPMTVQTASCKAGQGQYSLTWVDLGDATQVSAALQRMRDRMGQLLAPGPTADLKLRGMTPLPAAGQQRFSARPGEPSQVVRQAVFARGTRVYQLLMQSSRPDDEAWDVFVSSIALAPQ
ncbi:hypothetical protein [Roseateles terrae]|uniref:Lipoprotein n=1 Tax=Roseateles terrae TaxID=431060 RepID=A0ABR6GX79_9BURK|nr:hypothetical protein [Roseateles terrae]MBB3195869.1 hypothetical protein [Roseateles terrae]OWQ85213.1 hypothetical protein CDN98_17155 [Roseateles terrae]